MIFGMTLASLAALYSPSIVFGALFAWSYHKEPRQFRNAIWLLLFGPVIVVIFLLSNAVVVIRHGGLFLCPHCSRYCWRRPLWAGACCIRRC